MARGISRPEDINAAIRAIRDGEDEVPVIREHVTMGKPGKIRRVCRRCGKLFVASSALGALCPECGPRTYMTAEDFRDVATE